MEFFCFVLVKVSLLHMAEVYYFLGSNILYNMFGQFTVQYSLLFSKLMLKYLRFNNARTEEEVGQWLQILYARVNLEYRKPHVITVGTVTIILLSL